LGGIIISKTSYLKLLKSLKYFFHKKKIHESGLIGHFGINKTLEIFKKTFLLVIL